MSLTRRTRPAVPGAEHRVPQFARESLYGAVRPSVPGLARPGAPVAAGAHEVPMGGLRPARPQSVRARTDAARSSPSGRARGTGRFARSCCSSTRSARRGEPRRSSCRRRDRSPCAGPRSAPRGAASARRGELSSVLRELARGPSAPCARVSARCRRACASRRCASLEKRRSERSQRGSRRTGSPTRPCASS